MLFTTGGGHYPRSGGLCLKVCVLDAYYRADAESLPGNRNQLNYISYGKMPEWLNGTVSKTVYRLAGTRVRIPLFPPTQRQQCPRYK
jgi:hypothetical protein